MHTVRVPDSTANKLHRRRAQRIILGELQFGGKDASFKWCAFRALDQGLPMEHVIFRDGTSRDAVGWVGGEVLVLVEETFLRNRRHGEYECGHSEICNRIYSAGQRMMFRALIVAAVFVNWRETDTTDCGEGGARIVRLLFGTPGSDQLCLGMYGWTVDEEIGR